MDEHIRALETLPEPTKSLALNAARTGFVADVTALNEHILGMTTSPPLSCYHIVTTIFHFLGAQAIPDGISEIGSDLVIRARLLLEILSHLTRLVDSNEQYHTGIGNAILAHHDCVLPWLDFLQQHFFGRNDPIVADDEQRMMFTLAGILNAISRARRLVDYTKHRIVGEMVIHIWHKLLRLESVYFWFNMDLLMVVVTIDTILPMYLIMPTLTNGSSPQYIMDAVGGVSAVIAFTLARMERDVVYITPERKGIEIPCVGIRGGFTHLISFLSSPVYCHDILEQRVITRSINILKHLIEHGPPPAPRSDPPSMVEDTLDKCILFLISALCCGPEAAKEILDSGLVPILRTRVLECGPPLPPGLGPNQFPPYLLISNFVFPFVIKHSKRRIKANPPIESCPMPDVWRLYDAYVNAYSYLWDRAGEMASKFDKCTTCKLAGSDHRLKTCAGCHVTKYCSPECQRTSWENGHGTICTMFRCSNLQYPRITNCREFLYLAFVEHFALHEASIRSQIETSLAGIRPLPLSAKDDVPLFTLSVDPNGSHARLTRIREFPEIFGTRSWKRILLPKFRNLALAGRIKHLTVIVYPGRFEMQYAMGALASTIAAGMVDRSSWDREAENYESIRPMTWRMRW